MGVYWPEQSFAVTSPQVTIPEYLASIAQPGDMILTIGAGDIYRAGEALLQKQ